MGNWVEERCDVSINWVEERCEVSINWVEERCDVSITLLLAFTLYLVYAIHNLLLTLNKMERLCDFRNH